MAAGIPADLVRRRPDVRSADRQVASQSAQIGVAEADLYPTLFINGTLGLESQDISKLFSAQSFMGNITPNFRWNILNYGRIVNNVHLQQARTQELIATYQNLVLTAARETQTALRGFLRSQEQAVDLASSVKAAAAATELGLQQYRAGTTDFNRVFNLEITQVQQQDQLAVAQGNIALYPSRPTAPWVEAGNCGCRKKDGEAPAETLPPPTPVAGKPEPLPAAEAK